MDPIEHIKPGQDLAFALLLGAQKRDWMLYYSERHPLFFENEILFAKMTPLKVKDNTVDYYEFLGKPIIKPLHLCDITLLRRDPPFDMSYLHLTYILEYAEKNHHLILNKPKSVRDANEKIFASRFTFCCPPTLVSSDSSIIQSFLFEYKKAIFKPVENMRGHLIFLLNYPDPNLHIVIGTLTQQGQRPLMVQTFILKILTHGDKRILMIDGIPWPPSLIRLPKKDDIRTDLLAGAKRLLSGLTERDQFICNEIGPLLKKRTFFVGIDIIGDYLTEINVTSPTGIRQIEHLSGVSITEGMIEKMYKMRVCDYFFKKLS